MDNISCDVSEFQTAVNDTYPHRWLIFRVCDGDYLDQRCRTNLAWAIKARTAGKLDGFTVYVVYRPGKNAAILKHLNDVGLPHDCKVMIDAESWSGAITGDHSTEMNALATAVAKRQGSQANVWGYANRGDYAGIWPHRPAWLGLVVASYGGSKPASPGPGPLVGWQYTDGQYSVAGLPSTTAPFGKCDHNQLYVQEDDMPLSDADIQKIGTNIVERLFIGADGHPHQADALIAQRVNPLVQLIGALGTRVAQAQADLATVKTELAALKTGAVTVQPSQVPVTGTLKIGG
jgi:hypothetical protein